MTAGQSEERELRLCPRGFITRATPWLCGPCRLGRGTGRKKIEVCCGAQRLAKGNSGLQLARRTPSPTGSARGIREIGDAGGGFGFHEGGWRGTIFLQKSVTFSLAENGHEGWREGLATRAASLAASDARDQRPPWTDGREGVTSVH